MAEFNAMYQWDFNPRSHERSDSPDTIPTAIALNFNPRSHERSDCCSPYFAVFPSISIHAPTRGATCTSDSVISLSTFQSTLPREERQLRHLIGIVCMYFNPRSHERSDFFHNCFEHVLNYFNPRSHERSDSNIAQKIRLFLYNTDNKYIIR